MIGEYTEKNFDPNNYEEFYEHHQFQPISESDYLDVHEHIPRFGWAYDKVEELTPRNLLDLGCLDGSFALTISRHFNIPTVGVDLTKDGIELATARAKKAGLQATFAQGTIEEWLKEFAAAGTKFDMVTWFEIIEHVEDPAKCVELIDAILAPAGHVLVSTPDFESPLFGKDDEQNKCHVRLFTTAGEDYEAKNKFGNIRKATSLSKLVGKDRIIEMSVKSHLINALYK